MSKIMNLITYDKLQRIVLYWGFYNNNGPYIFKD
ncbi:hypothetical protein V305_02442 [Staphylococcus aureus H47224]|nr:hypothetical protein UEM_02708 [Staphylococcus aureus M1556]EVY46384.1 hypothetical protein U315_02638 [Staphylococcus aureus H54403]EWT73285.1 hypothetical protein V305_02442 [Staphylococcus aureus H47224]EWV92786.1 hypothetical protein V255_02687 [Staphylococcus aureus F70077]EYF62034.1 hypothetical protein V534_02529 [Staphylococcus aureus F12753]EYF83067.1 hypothetical protein V543_02667 [Staphylococcus aureus T16619]EYO97672.1 hypothetical protein W205_02678 [Staphylococcus aureus DAR